jgi:hypothetical protein
MSSNHAGAWIFVLCECCVLSGRGLRDELITCPEDPADCGASLFVTAIMRRSWAALGRSATKKYDVSLVNCLY